MNAIHEALTDMLWATAPFRNLLKGEARVRFLAIWNRASDALCNGRFNADEDPLQNPRAEAVKLHRLCLNACEALGVKPHDLVPQFNSAAEAGFTKGGDPIDHLTLLGIATARTARSLLAAREEKETA